MRRGDSLLLETAAVRDGDSCVIDAHKRWIGNGSVADVVVLWARAGAGRALLDEAAADRALA